MSTTFVTALLSVRANMTYTELGKGAQRKEHIANGTNRIVAQFGDASSREAFTQYCEDNDLRHPNATNEGFELRVSWATDELNPNNPDDVQRGMEHAYMLCHELAPDSPCWVTMHTDGDGGCVHAHATIVNHDERTGSVINKGDTSLYAPRVQMVNDELSRANGMQVLGADKSRTTWKERSATLDAKSFDRHLGDKIAYARDNADSMEAFKKNLEYGGVTLTETTKTDKKTGEVTTGWSYKAKDVWGPKMRTRKRRASKLCDEFTKEGIEAYFEEKQAQQSEILSVESEVRPVQTEQTPVESEQTREQSEFAATPVIAEAQEPETPHEAFHVYEPDIGDMYDMVGDLRRAYVKHCIGKGQKDYMDKTYRMFLEVEDEPDQTYHDLRAEVQLARDAFYESKAELEAMKEQRRNFAIGMAIFRSVNRQSKSPLIRMMSDMYAMMFRQMLQAQREEAERKLYERRREMWDAEKALKNELKRGEIGYKPHEMPAHLQRIVDGFGKDRDDEKSLGEW